MSDEEESMSEGFSASEDEWKPSKDVKNGESSDDDDSDFEGSPLAGAASGGSGKSIGKKRGESKTRCAGKQITKKRSGLSLRAKLYNKYRPPPKTFSPPESIVGKNSPTASTSGTNSKNAITPNESKNISHKSNVGEDSDSSSDSSIDNYLVNPEHLDFQSSFFDVEAKPGKEYSASPVPNFDCNAGLENLSDSVSVEDLEESKDNDKAFDFNNLLEYAKTLEQVKESVDKHNAEVSKKKSSDSTNIDTLDVYAVLALGEKQNRSHNDGEDEDDEDDERLGAEHRSSKKQHSKLSKTKSTRIKRHTKTRPSSTVAANDTDDSDWEEVADKAECDNVVIHVELPSRNRDKKTKTQIDIEMAFRRKINRDIKERQVLLHKSSLLCCFGRNLFYNRMLNDTILMQNALKLLPSKSAYPPDKGIEIAYLQSMVKWFKSTIKLRTQNLFPEKSAAKTRSKAKVELLKQMEKKEARCKQDMVFMLVILLRGMGLQSRLVVNLQPLPLRPAQSDLLTIKLKKDDESSTAVSAETLKKKVAIASNKADPCSEIKATKQKALVDESKKAVAEKDSKMQHSKAEKSSNQKKDAPGNLKVESTTNSRSKPFREDDTTEKDKSIIKTSNDDDAVKKRANKTGLSVVASSKQIKISNKNAKHQSSENETKPSTSQVCDNSSNLEKSVNDNGEHISAENSKSSTAEKNLKSQLRNFDVIKEKLENSQKDNKTQAVNKPALARLKRTQKKDKLIAPEIESVDSLVAVDSSQKENQTQAPTKTSLARLKRTKTKKNTEIEEGGPNKKLIIEIGSAVMPTIVVHSGKGQTSTEQPSGSKSIRATRSRSKSPLVHICPSFLVQSTHYKEKFPGIIKKQNTNVTKKTERNKSPNNKVKISTDFLKNNQPAAAQTRVLRSRLKANNDHRSDDSKTANNQIPQLDGADDETDTKIAKKKPPNLKKLKVKRSTENSDEDFEPTPPKKPKTAPDRSKPDRRVLSSDDEDENMKRKQTAGDMWLEVWCDVEEQWVSVDIFKGKIHCVDDIRKSASSPLAYVFAFQNDLSIKDVTARYCTNWATVVRKSRIDKAWLDAAISKYLAHRTKRDIKEDHELRRIHEEKPMPTAISDYKNHPFYALERHLLKFEAIYPPDPPALGYVRGETVYSRDCVHTLHSREIWLKQARTVKLGEQPYKIVKARPKWDRINQTVIKDLPLEIFGYWQTQDYEPPTAENGMVPRNAYGNVELFQPSMLPKKTKHIRLPGLNRICKKLNIDCAAAVVGFDFHQGVCHPSFDGFIVCEEFEDQVVAAWHQDQEEQDRKEQEKYEARVYGNWKKLIRGLLIREHLKVKYNF